MPDADPLIAGMRAIPGARRLTGNGVAEVFELPLSAEFGEVMSGTLPVAPAKGESLAAVVASAPERLAVSPRNDLAGILSAHIVDPRDRDGDNMPAGQWTYYRRPQGAPVYELARDSRGLVLRDAVEFTLDGEPVGRGERVIETAGRTTAVAVDGDLVDIGPGHAFTRLAPGALIELYTDGRAARVAATPRLGDCNRYDNRDRVAAGLDANVVSTDTFTAMRLAARYHSSCAAYALDGVRGGDVIRVGYEQRSVGGAAPRSCLWQSGVERCAPLMLTATRNDDWYRMSALYKIPNGVSATTMYFYADEAARNTDALSEAWYRNLEVEELTRERVERLPVVSPRPARPSPSESPLRAQESTSVPAPRIDGGWELGDCARTDDRTFAELGISATPLAGDRTRGVRLEAHHHSACVAAPVANIRESITYEVSFDANVVRGAKPRICMWEDAAAKCAPFIEIEPDDNDEDTVYRGHLDANPGLVRLFVYADATRTATTIEYRDIELRAAPDEVVVALPNRSTASSRVPDVAWSQDHSGRYQLDVRGADQPFVVALNEAYSKGWQVRGVPDGGSAKHVQLDGYRNGWVIDGAGDYRLTLEYAPARAGRVALRVSQVTALALVAAALFTHALAFVQKRRSRRRLWASTAADEPGARPESLPVDWFLPKR
jgi:arabinofuranan 3-O-arabinosyltransferase